MSDCTVGRKGLWCPQEFQVCGTFAATQWEEPYHDSEKVALIGLK